MKNLGFVGIAIAALAVSGCGGGGSSTPAAPVATPTAGPTAAPTPGQVTVAYTTTFGVSGSAANASNIAFLAPTETAAVTAAQANYTGSFTAASSCAQVTVTPATSTTGAFTVTAADAATTGCTVTFTGSTTTTGTLAATVAKPSGVALRWYTPNYLTQSPPLPIAAGPINLVGTGATFSSILAISEANYVGGFPAAKVVVSAGCTGFATVVANTATPAGLAAAAPGSSLVFYTVTGVAPVNTTGGCTVTATDSYVPLSGPGKSASIDRRVDHDQLGDLPMNLRLTSLRAASVLAAFGALVLAGCGGGSSKSMLPIPANGATNPANTVPTMVTGNGSTVPMGTLSVTLPNHTSAQTQSTGRVAIFSAAKKPAFIDTTTANSALVVSVTPQDPSEASQFGNLTICYNLYTGGTLATSNPPNFVVTTSAPNVASTVTIAVPAPPGTDGFQITQYSGQCGSSVFTLPTPPPSNLGTSNVLAQTPVTEAYMAPGVVNQLNQQILNCTPAPAPVFRLPTYDSQQQQQRLSRHR